MDIIGFTNSIYIQFKCHFSGWIRRIPDEFFEFSSIRISLLELDWIIGKKNKEVSLCKYGDNIK